MHAPLHSLVSRLLTRRLGALLSVVFFSGCIETTVRVHVQPDGSGIRRVEMAWEEEALEDLDLDEGDVRALLDLAPERGWTMRHESRPTQGGGSEPHLVFLRETQVTSVDEWPSKASDLNLRAGLSDGAQLRDTPRVEVGRGPGYRTITYREVLDGREIRELLDRMAARHLAGRIAETRPGAGAETEAEIRGLILGHLSHLEIWLLEDDDVDLAQAELEHHLAPHLARILGDGDPSAAEVESVTQLLREIFEEDDDLNERLERELPGLSLMAFMNLKLEIVVPGMIVESNADRIGESYAAWEGPIWEAINTPQEFLVRSEIRD